MSKTSFDFDCSSNFVDLYKKAEEDNENSCARGSSGNKSIDLWFEEHHPLHEIQNTFNEEAVEEEADKSIEPLGSRRVCAMAAPSRSRKVPLGKTAASKSATTSRKRSAATALSTADSTNSSSRAAVVNNGEDTSLQPSKKAKPSGVKVFMEPTRKPVAQSKIYTGTKKEAQKANMESSGYSSSVAEKSRKINSGIPSVTPMQSKQQAILQKRLEKEKKLQEDEQKKYRELLMKSSNTTKQSSAVVVSATPVAIIKNSVKDTRAWEKRTGKRWLDLSPEEREQAAYDIARCK